MSKLRIATLALLALAMSVLLAACGGPGSNNVVPGSDGETYALNVSVQGPGTVVIEAIDFTCSDECTTRIGKVPVELRAQADSGKGFVGWQQACSGTGITCTVTMDGDANVSAVFADNVLSLDMAGDGSGTVRIVPPDVNCEDDCTKGYPGPVSVSLTVTLSEGTRVEGWGADCSESGTTRQCVVDVSGQTDVSLTLVQPPVANPDSYSTDEDQTLSVGANNGVLSNDSDTGGGSLSAQLVSGPSEGTLDLDADGSFTYTPGAPGEYNFSYRAKDSSDNLSNTAQVTITVRRLPRHTLTVNKTGLGSGSVTSDPSGIDCGGACSGDFKEGTSVTLTASPSGNSSFGGWSGACSGQGTTCTVGMNAAKEVTARFDLLGFPLTASVEGPGTVRSSPGGIDCEPDCEGEYPPGTTVTLTATPDQDSTFQSWGGACSDASGSTCQVEMTQSRSISASFEVEEEPPPPDRTLNASTGGDGQGSITSSPKGINCGGDCSATYPDGTDVTLTATAEDGSSFGGWGGDCAGEPSNSCQLEMTADQNVSAQFVIDEPPPQQFTLDVGRDGDGSGSIAGTGISCPGDCSENYDETTEVTLTADPDEGSELEGWSGGCDDETNGRCTVTMDADKVITATFNAVTVQHLLDVTVAGGGSGTVAGPGIACPEDCDEQYDEGTPITLTADPGEDSELESWSGCDNESNGDCSLTMNGDKNITASFSQIVAQFPLHVTLDGDGSVASEDGNISCPTTCDADYDEGDTATLTASPADESEFDGWSGACSGTENPCTLTIDGEQDVTASFSPLAATFTLALQFNGDGSGSVAIDPSEAGTCGEDCTETYDEDAEVTLTAQPDTGSVFQWGGDCSTDTNPCDLVMTGDKSVTISFDADDGADDGDGETGTDGETEG